MKPSILFTSLLLVTSRLAAAPSWSQQLEDDWILQARLEAEGRKSLRVTTQDDAAGGCDGVTNGRWGFHTAEEENPWWQVDLGESVPLAQVRLWNRCEPEPMAHRAAHFRVLLSADGESWQQAYEHDGSVFYGYHMPDRSPLTVKLPGQSARFVRIQLPGRTFLHLDEVEVVRADRDGNAAAHRPADQSSVSQWSAVHRGDGSVDFRAAAARIIARHAREAEFAALKARLDNTADGEEARSLYLDARARQRDLALRSPLLDFDSLLITKRVPGSYSHMSDQYYGWWSRPGGGLYLLKNFKSGEPVTESLTDSLFPEPGSFLRPALSDDAKKVIFAWCKHYPHLASLPDKLNKANVPEDAFYHVFEMNLDGTGLRQLTHGKYDDFDARYLPDGRIVFLSTRRGQAVQVTKKSAAATLQHKDLPDCYVRCGGGAERPVAVYTLHTMNADGRDLTPISPFEMFEWEPSVAPDGTILYSRWDYVDRDNMPYMSLWAINPDGTNARLVYGNYTQAPHCTFEPRAVPGSRKIIFTASGHHSQTMGSLVLLDPTAGQEGEAPITRLTPDTPFPEIEGWPTAFYANPWPLTERTHLVAWGVEANMREGHQRPANGMGIYLFDADHGLELLFRDPDISSMYPIPVKAQPPPPVLASTVDWDGPQEGKLLVSDVTRGLASVKPGDIKALRVVALPAKTQPWMNQPAMGLTRDDPGKAVLGTVPVESDGSAYFRVPSGVPLFLQALDASGRVVQSMRSATHVQPGQTLSCTGCHDSRRDTPPPATSPLASRREASRLQPGPHGSWPLRFDQLIQPVLDAQCTHCHSPGSQNSAAATFDLTPAAAYESLAHYGRPSLRDTVLAAYRDGVSTEGRHPAQTSPLLALLPNHHGVRLSPNDLDRFHTWLDTYGQRTGAFSQDQEKELLALREFLAPLLDPK